MVIDTYWQSQVPKNHQEDYYFKKFVKTFGDIVIFFFFPIIKNKQLYKNSQTMPLKVTIRLLDGLH